ncbi:MAG: hypothetical protein ABSG15_09705 [FCB group bacterium]|jgi:hypothetical protein
MKNIFIYILVLFISANYVLAQHSENFPFGVGPFVTLKGGVNAASVPSGIKNDFTINGLPDFGATGYIPLTEKSHLGLAVDLAYSSYFYDNKHTNASDNWTSQASYITLGPNLYVSGFIIGLNFGLPLSIKAKLPPYYYNFDNKTSDLAFMVEVRLGGMIPLYYNEFGRLTLIIQGGYFLTGQMTNLTNYNPHPASGSIGIGYIFNLQQN